VDYLLQGFNYVDGSLNVYYCNETENVTGECINYEECQHSGTVEYDCLSDDTSYFWFDAFAVGNNTPILGEFQYINGGYAYDNIENNTLLWTERYMIRFNVSVGENVTLGNYTNTANVSGYHDFERNFLIDYPDDSLEGCLTHNNYNETSGSCINSSITDDNDRTSSVIFIVLPEPEIDLMPKTLLITQNQTQNQTTANVTATINNSGNVSVNNVKIELLVDNFSMEIKQ